MKYHPNGAGTLRPRTGEVKKKITVRSRVPEKQSDYRPRSRAELDHTATASTTVRIVSPGDKAPWATLELDPELTGAIRERAARAGLDFGEAFTGLVRDFFHKEGKETV